MSAPLRLSDFLRAVRTLNPGDDATSAAIARLLGIDSAPFLPRASAPETESRTKTSRLPEAPGSGDLPPSPVSRTEPAPPADPWDDDWLDDGSTLASALVPLEGPGAAVLPAWLVDAVPLPATAGGPPPPPPAPAPLLEPARSRAVLAGALSTLAADGELDVEAAVRTAAAGQLPRELPVRTRPTLARGVQLLVDRGEAMLPFAADVEQLLERMVAVVGAHRLQVLEFDGTPLGPLGSGPRWEWTRYEAHLPPPGTVVVAVTDLGIGAAPGGAGGAAVAGDWRRFARPLLLRGFTLRLFVPYPERRWPRGLPRGLRVFPWDRATGARTVARILAPERPSAAGEGA